MMVCDVIARTLVDAGARVVFGLIGSGNFIFTNALRDAGAAIYLARHESNATSMADGYARASSQVGLVSVHQGPGFTNTLTHLTEAAKSRTPLVMLAADTPTATLWSNFKIDQAALAVTAGAIAERIRTAGTAGEDAARAFRRAQLERRPVVLSIPIDLVEEQTDGSLWESGPVLDRPAPAASAVAAAVAMLCDADRPAIIAGRGAAVAGARTPLEALGDRLGAVLATSAGAHGLFTGSPFCIGIAGGFASPLAQELLSDADLVLAFGASLNHWTTRHRRLFSSEARVVQVDVDGAALGALHRVDLGIVADAGEAARALARELERRGVRRTGYRDDGLAFRIANRRWRDEPYDESSTTEHIDPRTLSIALDDMLPIERTIATDGGHFLGYPSMYMRVPDESAFVFPQGFQCIGQGLGAAIGAAIGRPDRLTVAVLGDGGALMALSDLETAVRYRLPMLIVIYNDAAYGAELHHFEPMGHAVDLVRFPDTDFAALARAVGAKALTVRAPADLEPMREWLQWQDGPFLIDAKVNPNVRADWLKEAFLAH